MITRTLLLIPAMAIPARAQDVRSTPLPAQVPTTYYAPAYNSTLYMPYGYGWGGWGGTTVLGDAARGMGAFAMGVGVYNRYTAEAVAIRTDAAMRFNEYLWLSQQVRNRQFWARQAARRERTTARLEQNASRLRNAPSTRDLTSGDALNAVLADLTAPSVYFSSLQEAEAPIDAVLVRRLPLVYAERGVTTTLADLESAGSSPVFRAEVIAADPVRFDSFRHSLAENGRTTLGELIGFLQDFHLRIGEARSPGQREAFDTLFARLSELRAAVSPQLVLQEPSEIK